jgi:hypothetical protein
MTPKLPSLFDRVSFRPAMEPDIKVQFLCETAVGCWREYPLPFRDKRVIKPQHRE